MSVLLALLPTLLTVARWILQKKGANEATLKAFTELISKAKADPAICLQMKDDVKSAKDELAGGGGQ